jgi:hypothetical protein
MIVERSTRHVYLLKPPSGKYWTLLALAPDEILLAEADLSDKDASLWLSRITRIAASAFADWDAPL